MSTIDESFDKLAATANRIADERNQFKAQRDALLAAAKEVNSYAHDWSDIQYEAKAMERLRQAIAKCEE